MLLLEVIKKRHKKKMYKIINDSDTSEEAVERIMKLIFPNGEIDG